MKSSNIYTCTTSIIGTAHLGFILGIENEVGVCVCVGGGGEGGYRRTSISLIFQYFLFFVYI